MQPILRGLAWIGGILGLAVCILLIITGNVWWGLLALLTGIVVAAVLASLAQLLDVAEHNADQLDAIAAEVLPPRSSRPAIGNSRMKRLEEIKDFTFRAGD
ncbi:hypothetical protein PA598K_00329 [Paenibacillus sp. 598K]|uniref:hypothetical protein n=1 Tax=Paenibacillus sp. 598K TaxID=1117987 RepID=UPI000FF92C64|nr:hypothetical protein [Paenibacillus sp. 598K]GBF72093.1 hypothetical protein PA598K_00329 [Paenibacillus sp. 598K]